MLTEKENQFIQYWEQNRLKKKKVFKQLALGLPLAVTMIVAIFLNFFAGWYKRADMMIRSEDRSLIFVLLIAALLITAFVVLFSVRHKWDINEQYYKELLSKKEKI
jgi:hypothetical protein